MSGGVDSSVTAALLARAGYEVVGVTLQLYDHGQAVRKKGACCAGQDIHDARRVAEKLGIAHYVLDYEARFRKAVMEDFARSLCARRDADPLRRLQRTCQVRRSAGHRPGSRRRGAWRPAIMSSASMGPTGQNCIAAPIRLATRAISCSAPRATSSTFCAFRWAGWRSRAVRAIAAELGLLTADKPDSQDICFVPSGNYASVVEKLKPGAATPGEIVDTPGPRARPP